MTFIREHDVILLAAPFSLSATGVQLTSTHRERLEEAVQRHFVRSLKLIKGGAMREALERSCTAELGYRLIMAEMVSSAAAAESVLLTCSPPTHLALANLLERNAVFTAEVVGRVVRRAEQNVQHACIPL